MTSRCSRIAMVLLSLTALLSCEEKAPSGTVAASFLRPSVNEKSMPGKGGTFTLHISSNVSWTIVSKSDWLSVDPQSGHGNASVTVTCDPSSVERRSGVLRLSSEKLTPQTVLKVSYPTL